LRTKRLKTTKSGTVRKIVPPFIPSEKEKAEIELHDGDHLCKEIRIENSLQDARGRKVKLRKAAEMDVTVEADEKDTTADEKQSVPARHLLPRTTIRVITSVKPAAVNKDAATSRNSLDALENSGVLRMPIASRTASKNPATANNVGQIGFT